MVAQLKKILALAVLASVAVAQSSDSTSTESSSTSTESSSTSTGSSSTSTGSSSTMTSSTMTSSTMTSSTGSSSTGSSSSSTGSSSSTSSASATVTGGPSSINSVPAGAATDSPFGDNGFFLGLPSGVSAKKRQNPAGGFVGGTSCNDAARFSLDGGVLSSGGVTYGAGDETFETFADARGAGGIDATWFVEGSRLGWFSTNFFNNQAGFCSAVTGNLLLTFISPADDLYPEGCEDVSFEAIDADRCVNGEIVPINNGGTGCEYPIGIPRGDDFFITGCPTPTGEICRTTVVSWISGELTFLPEA